jgi:uncharacterized secreted protein with C-terminal beta-propeller domain
MRFILLFLLLINLLHAQSTIEFKSGWQLVGVGSYLKDMSAFDNKDVEIVWGFDGESQSWRAYSPDKDIINKILKKDITLLAELEPWQAVWVYSRSSWLLHVKDDDIPTEIKNDKIKLYKGWNLIEIPQHTVVSDKFFGDDVVWKYGLDNNWSVNDKTLGFASIKSISSSEGLWVKSETTRTISVDSELSKLHTFTTKEQMLEYIRVMLKLNNYGYIVPVAQVDGVSNVAQDTADQKTEDATTTNLQEEGVDEGDILKHNSEYIFSVDNSSHKIIVTSFKNIVSKDYKPLYEIDMRDKTVVSMYLENERLSVISYVQYYHILEGSLKTALPYYEDYNQYFTLDIYDVSDIENISVLNSYNIDGTYQDSRLINGELFVISQFYPHIEYDNSSIKSENLIPHIYNEKWSEELVKPDSFYAPNKLDQRVDITTISRIDTKSATYKNSSSFLGNTHTYYASSSALYLVSSEYPLYYNLVYMRAQQMIYKFAFDEALSFKGRGIVEGRMLNQFSMSEKDEYLRVATTTGDTWSGNGTDNIVYTLKEDEGKLKVMAKLASLGKESESIKAVRFIGDRGFVVTFKRTDPLYTLDLSDPLNPQVAGELSISGFSEYLHVIDQNRILSIGRDADKEGRALALQISLYDISDFQNPKLADKIKVGDDSIHSSTYSEAEHNHKAFVYRSSDKIFGFAYTDYAQNIYRESFGIYQVDGMKIDELKTITNTADKDWGNSSRGVIFDYDSATYGVLFKGSNILSDKVKR